MSAMTHLSGFAAFLSLELKHNWGLVECLREWSRAPMGVHDVTFQPLVPPPRWSTTWLVTQQGRKGQGASGPHDQWYKRSGGLNHICWGSKCYGGGWWGSCFPSFAHCGAPCITWHLLLIWPWQAICQYVTVYWIWYIFSWICVEAFSLKYFISHSGISKVPCVSSLWRGPHGQKAKLLANS